MVLRSATKAVFQAVFSQEHAMYRFICLSAIVVSILLNSDLIYAQQDELPSGMTAEQFERIKVQVDEMVKVEIEQENALRRFANISDPTTVLNVLHRMDFEFGGLEFTLEQQKQIDSIRVELTKKIEALSTGAEPDQKVNAEIRIAKRNAAKDLIACLLPSQIVQLQKLDLSSGFGQILFHSDLGKYIEVSDQQSDEMNSKLDSVHEKALRLKKELQDDLKKAFFEALTKKQKDQLMEIFGAKKIDEYFSSLSIEQIETQTSSQNRK